MSSASSSSAAGELQVLEHGELHVLQHRERGEQRALLERHAVPGLDLLELRDAEIPERAAHQAHLARLRALQAEDGPQQHGFSRARAADDAEHLAPLDGHVEMVVHDLAAEAIDEALDLDDGFDAGVAHMSSCQKMIAKTAFAKITRKIDCTTATVVRRPSSREESRTCRPR